jgi:phosphoadenosine phosphosulfate reductase
LQDNQTLFEEFKSKFAHLEGVELVAAAHNFFSSGDLVSFSSFGSYSTLLLSYVAEVDKNIPIIFLETGKHFYETLQFVDDIKKDLGLKNIIKLHPDSKILANADENGNLWKSNVDRCCWIRKVEPLERYLEENPQVKAIITGRRAYQTEDRANMATVELDDTGRIRINPFKDFSKDRIITEFNKKKLRQHPLVAKGYPSIGCAPCTRAVKPGEDERSGRWAHVVDMKPDGSENKKTECGIHLDKETTEDWSI